MSTSVSRLVILCYFYHGFKMIPKEKRTYKYCFVPECHNSTSKTPDKIFFLVPRKKDVRANWCKLARRQTQLSQISTMHCCQDHFKLEEDTEGWVRYKVMKEAGLSPMQLRLKTDAAPRFFNCQPNRKTAHAKPLRSAVLKRNAKEAVQHAMESDSGSKERISMEEVHSTMDIGDGSKNGEAAIENVEDEDEDPTPVIELALDNESPSTSTCMTTPESGSSSVCQSLCSMSLSQPSPQSSRFYMSSPVTSCFGLPLPRDLSFNFSKIKSDAAVQVELRPRFRSVAKQCGISAFVPGKLPATFKDPDTFPAFQIPDKPATCKAPTSAPMPPPPLPEDDVQDYECDTESVTEHDNASSYHPDSTLMSEEWEDAEKLLEDELRKKFLEYNTKLMLRKSKRYLGVDPHNLFILNLLETFTGHSKTKIMLVLRKIRMNEANDVLGDVFGYCESTVGTIIRSVLPDVAECMKTYVFWPEKEVIRSNLPIAFRANYFNVESIIDCFEIQVEKPSKPSHQASTWSDYKKCNTVKYLLSITPGCFINYVSAGYGGRASDLAMVKKSGYLDKLPPNVTVMADRGFKNIGPLLTKKDCSLEKPPSCQAGEKMSEADVRQTKIIASLRIHVERVIRRLREYSFLDAHSRFHHTMFGMIDHIVVIACGLSNLQGSLIR